MLFSKEHALRVSFLSLFFLLSCWGFSFSFLFSFTFCVPVLSWVFWSAWGKWIMIINTFFLDFLKSYPASWLFFSCDDWSWDGNSVLWLMLDVDLNQLPGADELTEGILVPSSTEMKLLQIHNVNDSVVLLCLWFSLSTMLHVLTDWRLGSENFLVWLLCQWLYI